MRGLVAGLGVALLLGAAAVGQEGEAPAQGVALAVLSFNIRFGTADDGDDAWPHRRELVARVIRDRAPDVVGLQECLPFQREELLSALPAYAGVGAGRDADGGGEQSCILYRSGRLEVLEEDTFWLSETPETPGSRSWDSSLPRICTFARFRERATGRTFWVFNTHFDHRGEQARLESARLLASRVAARDPSDPAIVTGDLNAGEASAPLKTLLGPLRDTFRAIHPDAAGVATFHAFRGGTEGAKIDFVLTTEDVAVHAAEIVRDRAEGRYPSDHYPVSASLTLP